MICKKCQKEIDNDSKFCAFCGLVIENMNQAPTLGFWKTLFSKNALHFWLFFVATLLLVLTLINEPTIYDWKDNDTYLLVKFYIFCISLYFAILKFKSNGLNMAFLFVVTGIIFNPFLSLHFSDNDTISLIVFISAIFFGYFGKEEYKKVNPKLRQSYKKWIAIINYEQQN